jgi:hypothetical protein
MSAYGHKRTLARVRIMSALPPKADIGCACWNVRLVPIADIRHSLNYLLGALLKLQRHVEAERPGGL